MHGLVGACDALEDVHAFASITLLVAAAVEDDDVEDVATESEDRRDQHDFAVDVGWVNEPLHCFDQ